MPTITREYLMHDITHWALEVQGDERRLASREICRLAAHLLLCGWVRQGEGESETATAREVGQPTTRDTQADGQKVGQALNCTCPWRAIYPTPESALRHSLGEPDPGACGSCRGNGYVGARRYPTRCEDCNGTGNAPVDESVNKGDMVNGVKDARCPTGGNRTQSLSRPAQWPMSVHQTIG